LELRDIRDVLDNICWAITCCSMYLVYTHCFYTKIWLFIINKVYFLSC